MKQNILHILCDGVMKIAREVQKSENTSDFF